MREQLYSAVFLNAIPWPLFADFETPTKYGLAGMVTRSSTDIV